MSKGRKPRRRFPKAYPSDWNQDVWTAIDRQIEVAMNGVECLNQIDKKLSNLNRLLASSGAASLLAMFE